MAHSVRKICAKLGSGHQYLLGTAKPSAYGCQFAPDPGQPQHPSTTQVRNERKPERVATVRQSPRPVGLASQHVSANQRPAAAAAAVVWFRGRDAHSSHARENTVSPLASLTTTVSDREFTATKPDKPLGPTSCADAGSSDSKGLPSAEQLDYIFNKLGEDLPLLFKQNLNYALYHPSLVFENNIRGTKSVGLQYFMTTISILRLMGHLKYAFVRFDILKITKHPEDGTVKIRWRINGITGMKVFLKFWKFRLWNLEQVIKENIDTWHDGFSVFVVGSDGLVHKLTADKMQPDNDPVIEEKNSLATKLALFLGITPQLDSLGCLVTFDSEPTNELLKMVMMSLEDVI